MLGSRHYQALAGLVLIAMAGCSAPRQTSVNPDLPDHLQFGRDARGKLVTNYKVGTPYEVAGKWYYPAEDYGYQEEGIASWYGPGFHGKRTANGEVYDMNALTAAHKTLPMPSVVQVTNLENGRTMKVRINDRGPFVDDRIIDLSRRSAQLLGVEQQGIARVRVEFVPEDSLTLKNLALDASGGAAMPAPEVTAAPRGQVVTQGLAPPVAIGLPTPPAPGPLVALSVNPEIQTPGLPSLPSVSTPSTPSATPTVGAIPSSPAVAPPVTNTTVPSPISTGVNAPAVETAQTVTPSAITATPLPPPSSMVPPAEVALATPSIAIPSGVFIQAGAFTDLANARRLEAQLSGLGNVFVAMAEISGRVFHRVRVGPIPDRAVADQMLQQLRIEGYGEARIIED